MKKIIYTVLLALVMLIGVSNAGDIPKKITAKDGSVMILINKGDCIIGDDETKKTEYIQAFYIDKYEVSNSRYKKFLEWVSKNSDKSVRHPNQPQDKNHTPRYWKKFSPDLLQETGIAQLQKFDKTTFIQDNHPVVGIDWYDAYAYAKWAGKKLPTQKEWEKAARGTRGNLWPWGDKWVFENCNSGGYEWKGERDGYIYSAPINSYHSGASPYGVYNMSGNVWEWTADDSDSESLKKIIKGGGSESYPSSVMPSFKKEYEPEYRYFALGFRCAKSIE